MEVDVSEQEGNILNGAGVDIDAYRLQRLLLQIQVMSSFVSQLAFRNRLYFLNEVSKQLTPNVKAVLDRFPKIEFQDVYALQRHMETYFTFDTPENLLTKLFHALRQESLIRRDANAHDVFLQSVTVYVRSIGGVVRPYLQNPS